MIDNGDEGRKGRQNPNALLQIDKGGALLFRRLQKITSAFDKKKSPAIFNSTYRIFCCRSLCIAPVQLQNKIIGNWPLRAAGGIYCVCSWHTHTDTQDAGIALAVARWEKRREGGKDKSVEESMSCACVRSRLTSPGTSTNANVL